MLKFMIQKPKSYMASVYNMRYPQARSRHGCLSGGSPHITPVLASEAVDDFSRIASVGAHHSLVGVMPVHCCRPSVVGFLVLGLGLHRHNPKSLACYLLTNKPINSENSYHATDVQLVREPPEVLWPTTWSSDHKGGGGVRLGYHAAAWKMVEGEGGLFGNAERRTNA